MPDKGNVRDSFFCNQLKQVADVTFSEKTDFKLMISIILILEAETRAGSRLWELIMHSLPQMILK